MADANIGSALTRILSGMAAELARGPGPVKWCKTCGRKHPTRAGCFLTKIAVEAKSGRVVERYTRRPG